MRPPAALPPADVLVTESTYGDREHAPDSPEVVLGDVVRRIAGHADADDLIEWMRASSATPSAVYVTHGEPAAADTLRARITHELGWPARVPEHLETVRIA